MSELLFSKIIPGGNATVILHEPVIPLGSLAQIAKRLMDPMHVQAEQVGALYVGGQSVPHLEMMGGEFCVNATRAATLVLAGMEVLRPVAVPHCAAPLSQRQPDAEGAFITEPDDSAGAWEGEVLVSGMPDPVRVLACRDARTLALYLGRHSVLCAPASGGRPGAGEGRTEPPVPLDSWQDNLPSSLYCATRVDCSQAGVHCREIQDGVCLVRLPGMAHVLVDADLHPLPGMERYAWQQASAAWRSACGISRAPASGVVWYKRQGKSLRIWPAVEVRASGSEHMETACGSASLALALWEQTSATARSGIRVPCPYPALDIIQPSGESLLVFLEFSGGAGTFPSSAWIAGPVQLAAHGRAYV